MKRLNYVTVFLAAGFLLAHATGQPVSTEELVRRMVNEGSFEGQMSKRIGTTGDAAAVMAIKVLGPSHPTPRQIDGALLVLNIAFADPSAVQNASDREPRATMLLLNYLDLLAKDASLRKRIADTRKHVYEQVEKSKRAAG